MTTTVEDEGRWFEWQDHDGNGCPLPIGTAVQIEGKTYSQRRRAGEEIIRTSDFTRPSPWHDTDWGKPAYGGFTGRVLRYRVRRYASADRAIATACAAAGGKRSEA